MSFRGIDHSQSEDVATVASVGAQPLLPWLSFFYPLASCAHARWCYYKETHRILGQTFGMCVLQDFEALTPNLLARTVETVEGGGLVVLLLRSVNSLKQVGDTTRHAF